MDKLTKSFEKIFLFLIFTIVSIIFLDILFQSEELERIFSHERLLTVTTMALAGLTCWLVIATRELSEVDKAPWLFIDGFSLTTYSADPNFKQIQMILKNVGKVPVFYELEQPIKAEMNGTAIRLLPAINRGVEVYQGGSSTYYIGQLYCPPHTSHHEGSIELKITYKRSDTNRHIKNVQKNYVLTVVYSPNGDFSFHWHERT